MFKQLLTFLLAGMLVLETPAAAYAAGCSLNLPAESSEAGRTGIDETNEDGSDTANLTGGQSAEQADDESDEASDEKEKPEKDSDPSEETGNEGNDADDKGEGSRDETLDDSDEEAGDNESGDDSSNETGGAEEGSDPSDETENGGDDAGNSEKPGDPEDGGSSSDIGGESDENTVPEGSVSDADMNSEHPTDDTVSSNDLIYAQSDVEARATVVTEISYAEAVENGVEIKAPYGTGNVAQYSFTAPADGRYVFYTEEKATSSGYIFFVVNAPFYGISYSQSFTKNQYYAYMTDYMRQGDKVTIRSYAQTASDDGYSYTIKMAAQNSMIDLEDGSYNAVLPGGQNIVISAEAGIRHLRFQAKASEGKWMISSFYRTAERPSRDSEIGDLTVETAYKYTSTTTSMLEQGTAYDVAYMVFDSNKKFVAAFTNILTTKTSDTGKDIYIHSVKTDVAHQITLDVEYIGDEGEITCYYTAEGTSSPAGSCKISGWVVQNFTNLRAGSRYLFEFLGTPPNNELLLSAEYVTSGSKVEIATLGSFGFNVAEDFQTMTMQIQISHNQAILSKKLIASYSFTDAIGVERKGEKTIWLNTIGESGEISAEIDVSGMVFVPGEDYPISVWLEFPDDNFKQWIGISWIFTPDVPDPDISADTIRFQAAQNEANKTKVDCTVEIAGYNGSGLILFRPQNAETLAYRTGSVSIKNGQGSIPFYSVETGTAYDFILYVGGITKTVSVKTESDAGLRLERVEDPETDYVGAYDIVRTYRLLKADGTAVSAGSYYLRLMYAAKGGGKWYCNAVELNEENGYRFTVSTAALGRYYMQPDTDHTLGWLLGTVNDVTESNAVYHEYETIHTEKSGIEIDRLARLSDRWIVQVSLPEENVVNIRKNNKSVEFQAAVRKSNGRLDKYFKVTLNAANDYSSMLTVDGLLPETRYEFSIQGVSNGISGLEHYNYGFTTIADQRTLEVLTVKPEAVTARISYTLSGFSQYDSGRVICFYREKTDDDSGKWIQVKTANAFDMLHPFFEITGLKENTVYEYTIGIGKAYGSVVITELTYSKAGSFTTESGGEETEDGRFLSGPEVSVKGNSVTLSVQFSGNTKKVPSYVHFFYREKENGSTAYTRANDCVDVSGSVQKKCSVKVAGLREKTTYEFAAVLSDSKSICDQPDTVTKKGHRTEAKEFATGTGQIGSPIGGSPSIKLSKTELSLNVNEMYRSERGYGYEILKATSALSVSSQGFSWSSNDTSVISVSDGKVTAVAPGKATVTVSLAGSPDVSAVCAVTVGNYQMAQKNELGTEFLDSLHLSAVKGEKPLSGYTVCEVGTNDHTTETEFTVTSNNDAVASWNGPDRAIKFNGTGATRLIFETKKDHVKLYLEVTVSSAWGRGFTLTGFQAADGYDKYPAVKNETNSYTLAYTSGISYQAEGEIVPKNPVFNKSDFNWTIDNPDIATVDEWGIVTPLKAGDAVLTVTPKEAGAALYTKGTCTVTLHIQSLASDTMENTAPVYALADICSKIGDVKFPDDEAWKGWEWKEPATPLAINGVNKEYYPFEAVYRGEDHYPEEMTVNVYIAKITGISVYEETEPGHNQVVEVGSVDVEKNPVDGSDSITLMVEPLYYGSLNCEEATNYFYDVEIKASADVAVKMNDTGSFTITATKKGSYTLTPVIKVKKEINGEEKILAKTSYKIKAVEEDQAYISLKLEESVPAGVKLEDDRLIVDYNAKDEIKAESFKVMAELTDRNQANAGNFGSAKLIWSVTDKKVATVTASADTKSAEVKIIGEGHTILTAKVKDAAGHKAELKVEIQNHKPRVNTSNARVNLAFDYDAYEGRQLAAWSSGAVEIVPVYGEAIQSVSLYADEKAETPYSGLQAVRGSGYRWVISPAAGTKPGEDNYYLGVRTTFRDELYIYPLKVKVIEQQATVTAKSVRPANLFYRSDPGSLDIGIKSSYYGIESVKWTDNSADNGNGFASEGATSYYNDNTKQTRNTTRYYFTQQDIQLTDNKQLADTGIVNGKVEVKLGGYKHPNEVSVSLKWNYKKPVINTSSASVTLIPAVSGKKSGSFDLYNKTDAKRLNYRADSYSDTSPYSDPKYYYNKLTCSNENIRFSSGSSTSYSYIGSKTSGSEKFTVTLNGDDWREPLTAAHTIKLAAPKLYLTSARLTMNTNRVGAMYTYVGLKNAYSSSLSCEDIMIKGKDAKSQSLLDQDLLEIRQGEDDASQIVITENRASTMKQSAIANGSYTFTIAPCYLDADGNRIFPKSLSLKITVTDKAIIARTKASGSLDLTKGIDDDNSNYIRLDTTFQNIGSYYSVADSELVGEYSKYFNLHYNTTRTDQRLTIANESELKAGQKYKLAVRFTLQMSNGDIFTVTGAPFTVKPKQTAARINVYSNNQTLYAAADTVSRNYGLQVTNGDYEILSAEGSLDCNKDGRPDIIVSTEDSYSNSYRSVTVRLADRDGVLTVTGVKGKIYTIPVTVKLRGRDGISKDVKTSVKVTVKR